MSQLTTVPLGDLPSSRSLLRSTAIAAAVAALLLVTVVMPAEYGVDPTGVGRVIGLTEMGEIKAQLAKEAAVADAAERQAAASASGNTAAGLPVPPPAAVSPAAPPNVASAPVNTDSVTVTLRPNEGKEIKLAMQKGSRVTYSWSTDRGVVNYDTHADRSEPPVIKYHGYAKGQGKATDTGALVAAFDGMHGWFWRNRTRDVVTLTLRTTGAYAELKRMD